jgi:hypothetical protein
VILRCSALALKIYVKVQTGMALRRAAFWMVLTRTGHGWEITLWYVLHLRPLFCWHRRKVVNGQRGWKQNFTECKVFPMLPKTSSGHGFGQPLSIL